MNALSWILYPTWVLEKMVLFQSLKLTHLWSKYNAASYKALKISKGSLSFQSKGAGMYIDGNIVFLTDTGPKVWTKV